MVAGTALLAALVVAGCGDDQRDPPDARKRAVNACLRTDPFLSRESCVCLVDSLGLTPNEVGRLDKLEDRDVPDPNAEIERILGRRRADALLTTTARCNAA